MARATLVAALVLSRAMTIDAWSSDGEGRDAFNNHCRNCHSIKRGDNRLGPSMYGIFGAEAGKVSGYLGYSGGLSGFLWDETTLDRFIADPASISSGTTMIYPPVGDPVERKKIIAFLRALGP